MRAVDYIINDKRARTLSEVPQALSLRPEALSRRLEALTAELEALSVGADALRLGPEPRSMGPEAPDSAGQEGSLGKSIRLQIDFLVCQFSTQHVWTFKN